MSLRTTRGRPRKSEPVAKPDAKPKAQDLKKPDAQDTKRPTAQELKRKAKNQENIELIKASKKRKTGKTGKKKMDSDDDFMDELLTKSAPLPGQMENCEICQKRFTVTPYSRAGPNGGLLCTPCGKELDKDAPKKKAKKLPTGGASGRRRNLQKQILDGTYKPGAKSLMTYCILKLVKNIDLAEDLGDLPPSAIDKIGRALSKLRLMDSRTLNLFLQPQNDNVLIYDAARLSSEDIQRIFQQVPDLKNLKIRNGIQFKDEVMDYMLTRNNINLEGFDISGANLLSADMWSRFLRQKGASLKSLKVYFTDKHFNDDVLTVMSETCPQLNRIKMQHVQAVTGPGVKALANIKTLEHIGIQITHNRNYPDVHPDVFVHILNQIGAGLKTFSLTMIPTGDNTILDAIHNKCRSLQKLRLTDSEVMTDEGFVRLFANWENPPLRFIDLSKCRQLDSSKPRENPSNTGLCSNGFRALMEHSGKDLMHLNVHACRHISRQAFEEVFAADRTYPNMTDMEVSFCEEVDDFVIGSIFRSCPNVQKVNVFGCMKVRDVKVPRGKLLIGVPNAQGMQMEGEDEQ